jgi:hypothetical protein
LALWHYTSTFGGALAAKITKQFGVKVKTYKVAVENYDEVIAAVAQVVPEFERAKLSSPIFII